MNKYHSNLSKFFVLKPLYLDEPTQKNPNTRKLLEQPWQKTKAEMWDEVTCTLCNLDFIQAKAAARLAFGIIEDFNTIMAVIPDNPENISNSDKTQSGLPRPKKYFMFDLLNEKTPQYDFPENRTPWDEVYVAAEIERIRSNPTRWEKLQDFKGFIEKEARNLQKFAQKIPHFATQQAWNYSNSGPVGIAAENGDPDIYKSLLLCSRSTRPTPDLIPQVLKNLFNKFRDIDLFAVTNEGQRLPVGTFEHDFIFNKLYKIWPVKPLPGHHYEINSLVVLPDGEWALSGSNDYTFKLWDLNTCEEIYSRKAYNKAIAVTPDGRKAVIGSFDYSCFLCDLITGEELNKLNGHEGDILQIAITPDGKRALTCSEDSSAILWDLTSGEPVFILKEGYSGMMTGLTLSPDGSRAITCSYYKTCAFWDLVTGKSVFKQTFPDIVYNASITPDGKRAVCDCEDKSRFLWNLSTGEISIVDNPHSAWCWPIAYSVDGKRAVSGSLDNTLILWDTETNHMLGQFPATAEITRVSFFQGGIVASDGLGRLFFLTGLRELLCPGTRLVTARKIWDHEFQKYRPLSADCTNCGLRFSPQAEVIDTIEEITENAGLKPAQSPYLELPKMFWDMTGLYCNCPNCGEALKFNPFIA